jgi:predicted nucleic acid-binding protein
VTAWVVDTCILIDVLEDDPKFGRSSALVLDSCLDDGLALCPFTYVELAPSFLGDAALQDEFLRGLGVDYHQAWSPADTLRAHAAWHRFIQLRRQRGLPRRPLADILIGAFASRYRGLITRNGADFAAVFPELRLQPPAA